MEVINTDYGYLHDNVLLKGVTEMKTLLQKLIRPTEVDSQDYSMTRKKFITYLILVIPALTILLAACGGGGGGSDTRTDH